MTSPGPGTRVARGVALFCLLWAVLFAYRFVLLGHYIGINPQECHIGGIARELSEHGVRMPLRAYAPNSYNNGSFFFGAVAAGFARVLGPSFLAVKLVPHTFSVAGTVAGFYLLERVVEELGITSRRAVWTARACYAATAVFAPRLVVGLAMYAAANHTEGAALCAIVLAAFAARLRSDRPVVVVSAWVLAGLALYLAKGCVLAIAVMVMAELARWRAAMARGERSSAWLLALGGFLAGSFLTVTAQRLPGDGGSMLLGKLFAGLPEQPALWFSSWRELAQQRAPVSVAHAVVIGWGVREAWRVPLPVLRVVVGYVVLHAAVLLPTAEGGFDRYAVYGYFALAVIASAALARLAHRVALRDPRFGTLAAVLAVVAVVAAGWPPSVSKTPGAALRRIAAASEASACTWRFAEAFMREYELPIAPEARQHAVHRCRELGGHDVALDCISGISRALHWRWSVRVRELPRGLSRAEQRAFAFGYGTHRRGDTSVCRDFASEDLALQCRSAVQLNCLLWGDTFASALEQSPIGRPRCQLVQPPMAGFWRSVHADLVQRPTGGSARIPAELLGADADLAGCQGILERCY